MKRHGFTLVEIFAAIALLAVSALLFAHLVALMASERIAERTRQTAVDQMQNVWERLSVLSPDNLATDNFDKTAAESLIERSLPGGKIVFDTKRIESDVTIFIITVSWNDGESRPRKSVAMFWLLPPFE